MNIFRLLFLGIFVLGCSKSDSGTITKGDASNEEETVNNPTEPPTVNPPPVTPDVCADYPPWACSPYVLPFPIGEEFRISQGNCTDNSHQGFLRYSYDIEMPFGSVVTAAREGTVHAVRIDQPTGSRGFTAANWIQIIHEDGMISAYAHLGQYSNLVEVGDFVQPGDTIALTGDTGDVGSFPHLHFDLNPCGNVLACATIPVTFNNTSSNPNGLMENSTYLALEYARCTKSK